MVPRLYVALSTSSMTIANLRFHRTVFLQFLIPTTFAQLQADTESTLSAKGSPEPSAAAESLAPQHPIKDQGEGWKGIDGEHRESARLNWADV